MAVLRENNWLGQQRLDIPQFRLLESGIRGDFDLLAGTIFAGKNPVIVKGFALTATSVGAPASSIQVVVANSISTNFNATESGSMFVVPGDRANEILTSLNAKVSGSFTANATNYVGMDIRRTADPLTSDILQFLTATTLLETARTVPLARTLDYRFVISTTDFSSQPNLCPIAKVVTDASNNIASIVDARLLAFRLAPGGSYASAFGGYSFPGGRTESLTSLDMTGGDKSIGSQYDWMKAAMTRVQEIGGGEFWYSATADRNVTMIWTGATFLNGENFEWDGVHLHWKGIRFLFDNSTGYYNDTTNQITNVVGLTDLADGECIYVDLDRTLNRTGGTALVAAKAVMSTLGPGSVPGARNIIAWRSGAKSLTLDYNTQTGNFHVGVLLTGATSGATALITADVDAGATGTLTLINLTGTFRNGETITDTTTGSAKAGVVMTPIYTRNWRYPVGTTLWLPATTQATGMIKISRDYAGLVTPGLSTLNSPIAISDRGGTITTIGGTNHIGLTITGDGTGGAISAFGGATAVYTGSFTTGYANGIGVRGIGGSAGAATGVTGFGLVGVRGEAIGTGTGGDFYTDIGAVSGTALKATAMAGNANGITAVAIGTGWGIKASGTVGNGIGVWGIGSGTAVGGIFTSGAGATGNGVEATALSTNGIGVLGVGTGNQPGGKFTAAAAGSGVVAIGGSGAYGVAASGGTGGSFTASGASGTGVVGTAGGSGGVGGSFLGGGVDAGVYGQGGTTAGPGVRAQGGTGGVGLLAIAGAGSVAGVDATATGTAAGVVALGGPTGGPGVSATAGAGGGIGVSATGRLTGSGVTAVGGVTDGYGVHGTGGGNNGVGVRGVGGTNGYGVVATADATSPARAALRLEPQDTDPNTPQEGDIYYNGTTHKVRFYNGTVWGDL